jgi:hypothetical protein
LQEIRTTAPVCDNINTDKRIFFITKDLMILKFQFPRFVEFFKLHAFSILNSQYFYLKITSLSIPTAVFWMDLYDKMG